MLQQLFAYARRVDIPGELCKQDRWLGAIADAPQLFALIGIECDLGSAERVYTCDSTPTEPYTYGRLLWLSKSVFGQPFRDALASGSRNGLEGSDRRTELR
jgi:hypothetical protein